MLTKPNVPSDGTFCSITSTPPTYILELETFLKLRYLISLYAKSFLESFQNVLKSEIVEVHQRRRLRAGSSSENCQQSSEESFEKFLVLEEF